MRIRVAVFARAPVPGRVKTRLAPRLGAEGAARLHASLVRRALATALEARIGPVELWCSPDSADPFFAQCHDELHVALYEQQGDDLGERMAHAFERALADGSALIVIGSDCPALTPADLVAARDALRSADAAITPAEDGGYVLIALKRPVEPLFQSMAWGTAEVMAQTRERLAKAGVAAVELATRWDVDRPADYDRLVREGLLPGFAS